ncbi:macrophage mannose receptor 1-like protein [Aphelenchoides avenae]|nr:macrophage mannose receptor 1-like protein [Aphelenchus avenae]
MSTTNSVGVTSVWIGLFDRDGSFNWNWMDGTPYDYNNFAPGEPSPNELCMEAFLAPSGKPKGTWNNAICAGKNVYPALCSVPANLAA